MIKIGLIGYGYWGPNLARNFNSNPNLELSAICDFSRDRLEAAGRVYHHVNLVNRSEEIFKDSQLDAIAIATPVSTHFELAKAAMESGRHVWLEKPMTEKVEQGEELIELAVKKEKLLLVDHTFVYTGAVRKIRELVDKGELGDLIYYDSTRVNLGLFQQDVDVIWDLAPHDISIMDYLMPFKKQAVSATGCHYYGNHVIPKALLTVYVESNRVAHINVSWVSPVKIRRALLGGTSKIKVYDKGVEMYETKEELYRLKVQYRVGDMYAPRLETHEALTFETEHFANCILTGEEPFTNGEAGLEVVKILVASNKSLKKNGTPVSIS
jgi:predicted dehydrogenase